MAYSFAEATAGNAPVLTSVLEEFKIEDQTGFDEFVAPDFVNNGALKGQIPIGDTEPLRTEMSSVHNINEPANVVMTGERTYTSYTLTSHGLAFERNSEQDALLAMGGYDPDLDEMARVKALALKLWLEKHSNLYALVSNSGNYNSNLVNAIGTAWTSDASDPENDVSTLIDEIFQYTGNRPKYGVINDYTHRILKKNPAIRAILSNDKLRIPTDDEIAAIFGLERIWVTDCHYDSGRLGDDASYSRIWGSIMLIFDRPRTVAPSGIIEGRQFARTIRNAPFGQYSVTTVDKSDEAPQGAYRYINTVHGGYWSHNLISQDSSNDSTCAGILTGIYS